MNKFMTLVGAVAIALSFGTDKAHSQTVTTTAPFEITVGSTKFIISMNQGSYFNFTGGNLPGGLFFTGANAASNALLAAQSFAANYFPSTNTGVGTEPTGGFQAVAGKAYAFAYALASNMSPTTVFAHVAAFGEGTAGSSGAGETGVYQGVALDIGNSITTLENPAGTNDFANYVVNWADELSQQEIPEIDGPVLAQVGFVLAGLYFVMLGRRRRRDEMEMS